MRINWSLPHQILDIVTPLLTKGFSNALVDSSLIIHWDIHKAYLHLKGGSRLETLQTMAGEGYGVSGHPLQGIDESFFHDPLSLKIEK